MRTKIPTSTGTRHKTRVSLRTFSIEGILGLTLMLFILSTLQLNAQNAPQREIKGRVINAEGNPVPGVSVYIAGTKKGVTTSNDGRFTISADAKSTLEITSVGFDARSIKVGNQSDITITLEKSIAALAQPGGNGCLAPRHQLFAQFAELY